MGRLFEAITAFPNLLEAAHLASKGKRSRPNVAAFSLELEEELHRLQDKLVTRSYRPGPYRTFIVREKKPRRLPEGQGHPCGGGAGPPPMSGGSSDGCGRYLARVMRGELTVAKARDCVRSWLAHADHADTRRVRRLLCQGFERVWPGPSRWVIAGSVE